MHPTVQIAVVKEQESNDRYRLMCQQKGKSKCLIKINVEKQPLWASECRALSLHFLCVCE